jgi:exopolysaccharide production protein ExoZ
MSNQIRSKSSRGVINNVQALRGFAATAVVFSHATQAPGLHIPLSYGAFGVDIFFVISGFVISYIAANDPRQFELKRIIRIVPFYWAASIGVFLIALFVPQLFHSTSADWRVLVTSLFFIPHDRPNGTIAPMLFLGWTLNYEMYFYAIFAVALRINRQWAPLVASATIFAIMAMIPFVAPHSAAEQYYGYPIVVEFIYGIILFQVLRIYPATRNDERLNGWFYACAGAGLISLFLLLVPEYLQLLQLRYIVAGIPAAILLMCAVLFERRYSLIVKNAGILLVGDASYVLYLIHPYVVLGLMRFAFSSAGASPQSAQWAVVAFLIAVAIAIAASIHLAFERPVINLLRRRFLNSGPPLSFSRPQIARDAPEMETA